VYQRSRSDARSSRWEISLDVDAIQKWVTLSAAVLAAVASVLNLWWKFRDKSDKIRVACGLIDPQISPGEYLHVVSRCDHPMRIADYGYVMPDGRLFSIPQFDDDEPDDDQRLVYGSRCLDKRNDSFETGMEIRDRTIGVYAVTTSQTHPTIAFRYDIPAWQRGWVRAKILWKSGRY
jgi:hypothetical protein